MQRLLPSILIGWLVGISLCRWSGGLYGGEGKKTKEANLCVHMDRYGDPLPTGVVARLGTVRLHPPEEVRSLIFSHDGRFIISGIEFVSRAVGGHPDQPSQSIWIWESRTGKLVRRIGNAETRVFKLCLLPDGKILISSESNGVYLWDMETGKLVRHLETGKKMN